MGSESANYKESEKLEGFNQTQRYPKFFEKVSNHGKELLSCDKCEYQCKKENTLNKHRHNKHKPHARKVCGHKPPSMVDMLKHFANEHNKKMVQIRDIKEQNSLQQTGRFYETRLT